MTKAKTASQRRAAKRASAKLRAKLDVANSVRSNTSRMHDDRNGRERVGAAPERLTKDDVVTDKRGVARTEDLLARAKRQNLIDKNQALAGVKYLQAIRSAGLSGIQAQDLVKLSMGGDVGGYREPELSDKAALARIRLGRAWSAMGSKAASIVHGMLVEGRGFEEIGRCMTHKRSDRDIRQAGETALALSLGILAEKTQTWA